MAASHYKLDNLICIVDRNGVQIDGPTHQVMNIEPLSLKWAAFGWHTISCYGNNIHDILKALNETKEILEQPKVILAQTIMGKGISSIEGDYHWHGKAPTKEEAIKFLNELDKNYML